MERTTKADKCIEGSTKAAKLHFKELDGKLHEALATIEVEFSQVDWWNRECTTNPSHGVTFDHLKVLDIASHVVLVYVHLIVTAIGDPSTSINSNGHFPYDRHVISLTRVDMGMHA